MEWLVINIDIFIRMDMRVSKKAIAQYVFMFIGQTLAESQCCIMSVQYAYDRDHCSLKN